VLNVEFTYIGSTQHNLRKKEFHLAVRFTLNPVAKYVGLALSSRKSNFMEFTPNDPIVLGKFSAPRRTEYIFFPARTLPTILTTPRDIFHIPPMYRIPGCSDTALLGALADSSTSVAQSSLWCCTTHGVYYLLRRWVSFHGSNEEMYASPVWWGKCWLDCMIPDPAPRDDSPWIYPRRLIFAIQQARRWQRLTIWSA
jgi:hypothetical protein